VKGAEEDGERKREDEVEEEKEIEYIRGVAARKVKRLSANDKTASRRPVASKVRAVSLARSSSTNLRRSFAVFRRSHPPEISKDIITRAQHPRSTDRLHIVRLGFRIRRKFSIDLRTQLVSRCTLSSQYKIKKAINDFNI